MQTYCKHTYVRVLQRGGASRMCVAAHDQLRPVTQLDTETGSWLDARHMSPSKRSVSAAV